MSRARLLKWSFACIAGILLAWGVAYLLGPHPVYGPAKPVDLAEQMRLTRGPAKPPVIEQFPQLATKVAPASFVPVAPDPAGLPVPVSVSGRVSDKDTNAAIANASIRLVFAGPRQPARSELSAATDAEGRYEIPDIVHTGEILLFANAEGYCTMQADLDRLLPGKSEVVNIPLSPAMRRIAGRVLDQARLPLPDALVEVVSGEGGAGQVALSDVQGAFTIALPAEGEVTLRAGKEGYGQERFEGVFPGMDRLELILLEQGAIAGRVTDEKGEPRAGLNVVAVMEQEGSVWDTTTQTDENGAYRLEGLSPSYTYAVRVTLVPREDPPSSEEPLSALATYVQSEKGQERMMERMKQTMMPDSGLAAQTGVKVQPGQETTVDFRINGNEVNTALVYGRITDPTTGGPVCPMTIQGFWDESMASAAFLGYTTTNEDGTYELYLPAVIKREKVWIMTGWDRSKPAACVEADPKVPTELNLTVSAPIVVPVHCVNEKGAPLGGLSLMMNRAFMTGADGRGTVYGMSPYVTHTVTAYRQLREPYYNTVRMGESAPFSGKPGETIAEVEIQCSERAGSISGQLVIPPEAVPFMYTEEPSDVFGFLRPEAGEAIPIAGFRDAENKFMIEPVGEGKYRLELILPVRHVEAQRRWWAMIDNVEIVAGQNFDVGIIHLSVTENPS